MSKLGISRLIIQLSHSGGRGGRKQRESGEREREREREGEGEREQKEILSHRLKKSQQQKKREPGTYGGEGESGYSVLGTGQNCWD